MVNSLREGTFNFGPQSQTFFSSQLNLIIKNGVSVEKAIESMWEFKYQTSECIYYMNTWTHDTFTWLVDYNPIWPESNSLISLTQSLQVEMDEVNAVVLHALVRFRRNVQVAVTLFITHVHLHLCGSERGKCGKCAPCVSIDPFMLFREYANQRFTSVWFITLVLGLNLILVAKSECRMIYFRIMNAE